MFDLKMSWGQAGRLSAVAFLKKTGLIPTHASIPNWGGQLDFKGLVLNGVTY
jgi:hypothetical protein